MIKTTSVRVRIKKSYIIYIRICTYITSDFFIMLHTAVDKWIEDHALTILQKKRGQALVVI